MNILGIGGLLPNGSAALIRGGKIVAAVEQVKVQRQRGTNPYPEAAIEECLRLGKLKPEDIQTIALITADDPALLGQLAARFGGAQIVQVDQAYAHAASAYYASPFEEAVVLMLDSHGDCQFNAKPRDTGEGFTLERTWCRSDSLSALYSRVTTLLGFTAGADEHKVQWLSTSGTPRYAALFEDAAKGADLDLGSALPADIASSLQAAVTKMALAYAGEAANVCLAGGLAYNALLVSEFEKRYNVFVQPAAGNAGLALGAALQVLGKHADAGNYCLGPSFGHEEIKQVLENCKLSFRYMQTTDQVIASALDALAENKIVAWMQGRMEYGPRALGNRSILASPLDPYSTENLNTYIKHREAFRKFAASVPEELAAEYFEIGANARHLATVGRVKPAHKQRFQAALLGDDLIRVHAVRKEDNPLYWKLLHQAGQRTGLPVLYNTSFNLFGEPLVCTPRDAVRSFYSSGIDALIVGNFVLQK